LEEDCAAHVENTRDDARPAAIANFIKEIFNMGWLALGH